MKSLILLLLFFSNQGYSSFSYNGFSIDKKKNIIDELVVKKKNQDFRVMWWNILECGKYSCWDNRDLVIKNIKRISEISYAPDLIILGEFQSENFNYYKSELDSYYKVIKEIKYAETHHYSFLILSKKEISHKRIEGVNWYKSLKDKNTWDQICQENSCMRNYKRDLIELELKISKENFKIYPIHLLQPWNNINDQLISEDDAPLTRKIKIASQIIWKENNPMHIQAKDILSKLDKKGNYLMLGDFNSPKTIYGVDSYTYDLFKKSALIPLYFQGETYPTDYALSHAQLDLNLTKKLQIDQAYLSRKNRRFTSTYRKVLPFSGSDHYPLYFSLRKLK